MTFSKLGWMGVLVAVMTSSGCAEGDEAPGDEASGQISEALTLDAAATLQSMENALNQASSAILNHSVVTSEPGKASKTVTFKTYRKGDNFRLDFLTPADMKGTKFLLLSTGKAHVYTPAMGKTRQIDAAAVDGMMMGIACSLRSLADTRFSDTHNATAVSAQNGLFNLTLTRKPTVTSSFPRLLFAAQEASFLPTDIQYIDASNTLVARESRGNYTCQGSVCEASVRTCTRSLPSVTSTVTRTAWSINPTIADSVFLPSSLTK